MCTAVGSAVSFLSLGLTAALRPLSGGVEKPIGGSRIFLEWVTLGTRASEASEHWGGLGLREDEIWAFLS